MSDYVDGDLGARPRRRFERHVSECDECRGVLRGLRRMLARLHAMPPPAGPPDARELATRVRERVGEQPDG